MAALTWFLLALLLLAIALFGADFDGLLPAVLAALALSLLSASLPGLPLPLQALLFAALTAGLLLALQRWARRRRTTAIAAGSSSDRARVISGFEGGQEQGRVYWQGQSWAAINLETAQPLAPGTEVLVMGRDGNRLQVLAAEA
ncbi:MAG: hypothetical protein RLZZ423_1889 [Cyanobacteriota bacterium]|jgi:membrane protein implicated in regulation of membrane protease activity